MAVHDWVLNVLYKSSYKGVQLPYGFHYHPLGCRDGGSGTHMEVAHSYCYEFLTLYSGCKASELILFLLQGATALLVAVAMPAATRHSAIAVCSNKRTCHVATTLKRSVAMAAKGRTKLLKHLLLCQHGQFWHVGVSERQRLRLCGQNLCGAFVRLYWQPTSKRAI